MACVSMASNKRVQNESAVMAAIAKYDDLPYGASYRELSADTGLGLGTVFSIVASLVGEGRLEHTPIIARSIKRKL